MLDIGFTWDVANGAYRLDRHFSTDEDIRFQIDTQDTALDSELITNEFHIRHTEPRQIVFLLADSADWDFNRS